MSDPAEATTDRPDIAVLAEHLKERIYAALTIVAVTLGLALSGSASHLGAALSVIGTALGLWLATLAAEGQAHRVVHGRMVGGKELRHMLFVSSPLLTAAVGPLVLVGLSALAVMPLTVALYLSVAVDTAALFVWGCLSGRRMGTGVLGSVFVGLVNLLIGAVVIGIKLAAGH